MDSNLTHWTKQLRFDPLQTLLSSSSKPVQYFTRRDLTDENPGSIRELWRLPEVEKMVGSQLNTGAWSYHGGRSHIRSREDYDQLETYRILRLLVEKFGLSKEHSAIERAATFLFSHQTGEGDFRGIAGNQYIPYYSAGMMELLIKSGYDKDMRIERGIRWLISMRQNDGGWAFPMRTVGKKLDPKTFQAATIHPDRSKPFSHLVTGIVLRAFAAHSKYRNSEEAHAAGVLLKSRFFQPDKYPDRSASSFWTSFSFPFWFTDLLSALDSLTGLGFKPDDHDIKRGLEWFVDRQTRSGLWKLSLRIMARDPQPDSWISLAICRVFKRMYD